MKKFLSLLLMLFMGMSMWAGTIVFADLNLENGVQYSDPFDGGDFTVTFAGGANDGKYYTTGSAIRVYGGGSMTVAAKSGVITEITVTYDGSNKPATNNVVNVGAYDYTTGVWTGSASSVVFTRPSGSGHWRIKSVTATVQAGTVTQQVNAPQFSVNEGEYTEPQTIEITCSTEDANIYYTLDGNDPTTSSTLYTNPIYINETTTIKAIGVKDGYDNSIIVSATYTLNIPEIETDQYVLVTDLSQLTEGDEIIIANTEAGRAIGKQNANNRSAELIQINDNVANITELVQVFTLEGDENGWYFNTGNGYIYAASSTGNQLKTEEEADDNAKALIDIDAETIIFQGDNTRNYLRYNPNNGNPIFSCYGSNSSVQNPVQIYRKGAAAPIEYVYVNNIAEYNALPIGTHNIVFNNPLIVQYHYISSSKNYIYVKDDTGCAYINQPYSGTNSIPQLENGDIIAAGLTGNKVADEMISDEQSSYAQFTNLKHFELTGNKGLAEPEVKTVNDITTNATVLNNHYIVINKVKLTNLYDANLGYGGAKYFDIDDTEHIGYNKFNIDWSVVDDLDAYYNVTAIFTAYNNQLEVHPTEVVKWAEEDVTLKELCATGIVNNNYRISNNVQGVFAKGTSLWVKDENGQSLYLNYPEPDDDNFDVALEDNPHHNQGEYDQSNWCEIVFPTAEAAASFVNKIIEGYSIEGQFADETNPKLILASTAQVKVYGNSDIYNPNYYMPANFTGTQTCNSNMAGQPGHGTFFFMNPKPQEYVYIAWAVWDDTEMIMSPDPARNTHLFIGHFNIDLSMNDNPNPNLRLGYGYNFHAIVQCVNGPKDAINDNADSYIVYPLDLEYGEDPITAINTINAEVKSIKYVDIMGRTSENPFNGMNVVVTEFNDGTKKVNKRVYKF